MSSKYRIPRNPDCPLSKRERDELVKLLDFIQWNYYHPYKWTSGGYAEVKVTEYDEVEITVSIKHGVEGDRHFDDTNTIERFELLTNVNDTI